MPLDLAGDCCFEQGLGEKKEDLNMQVEEAAIVEAVTVEIVKSRAQKCTQLKWLNKKMHVQSCQ